MAKVNQLTLDHIMASEGLRLEAYPDPGSSNGKPVTIGYGTTKINGKEISLGTKITKAQAAEYFKADVEAFADGVAKAVTVPLNANQFGSLVSFAYNVGIGAFKSSTLLRKLNAGDYNAVPGQLVLWNKNDGKVLKGLVNRRQKEVELWNTPTGSVVEPAQKPTQKPVESVPDAQATDTTPWWIKLLLALLRGGK